MAKKRITVKDVAQYAGVSRGTVDRVLHDRGEVAPHVIAKVNHAVDHLGYRPNLVARSLATQKSYRIATVLPQAKKEGYWSMSQSGIEASLDEISDFGVELDQYHFMTNDEQSFIDATVQVIKSAPDAILIAAEFYTEAVSFFQKAKELNIPVLCINTQISEYPNLGYIGPDAFQCGIIAGRLFERTIPDLNKLLILNIGAQAIDQKHLLHKEQGLRYHFDQLSLGVDIRECDITEYKDARRFQEVLKRQLIEQSPQGIFVTNSRVHYLIPILEDLLISDMTIIGFDLIPSNLECLKRGKIDFLIHQNPKMQGAMGIRALFQLLINKQAPSKIAYVPLDIVMKENCEYYIK